MISAPKLCSKNIGHLACLRENGDFLHREPSSVYRKKPPFCLCAHAHHALHALITPKILRSKNAQCKTEESPKAFSSSDANSSSWDRWLETNCKMTLSVLQDTYSKTSVHNHVPISHEKTLYFNLLDFSLHPTGCQKVKCLRWCLVHKRFLFTVTWETLDVEMEDGRWPWRSTVRRYESF